MRTRKEITEDTYVERRTTVEVLLDIRDELVKSRGLHYLAMAPDLSKGAARKLAQRISEEIKKEN